MMKRLVSGVKSTGEIHIGNYFGAMKKFVDLQNDYESFLFIADYHALNQVSDPKKLSHYIFELAKAFLAIGIDPKKAVLFKQSDIYPVTELCWIFESITSLGILQRAHAYKNAKARGKTINAGLFNYPVLMAADILIYGADVVPVGEDQKQHLEITQKVARTFNNIYGDTFKIPEGVIDQEVAVIRGLDGRKMSKSYGNTIGLFDDEDTLREKIMSIKTDSRDVAEPKDPESCNIFALHRLFSTHELDKIAERYKSGQISYKESKEMLFENANSLLKPIRERKRELDQNPDYVLKVLADGKEKALTVASKKLKEVKDRIGVNVR